MRAYDICVDAPDRFTNAGPSVCLPQGNYVRVYAPFLFELARVCISLRLQEAPPSASAPRALLGHTLAQLASVVVILVWCLRWEYMNANLSSKHGV